MHCNVCLECRHMTFTMDIVTLWRKGGVSLHDTKDVALTSRYIDLSYHKISNRGEA